jgi:hypothetical protein
MVEMKEFQAKTRRKAVEAGASLEEAYVRFINQRGGIMKIFDGATVIGVMKGCERRNRSD